MSHDHWMYCISSLTELMHPMYPMFSQLDFSVWGLAADQFSNCAD